MECSRVGLSNRGLDDKKDVESGEVVKTATLSLIALDPELEEKKCNKAKENKTKKKVIWEQILDHELILQPCSTTGASDIHPPAKANKSLHMGLEPLFLCR